MSLDELAEELRSFQRALDSFTEILRQTETVRRSAEERAAGLWDDAFRQSFTTAHAEFAGPVSRFIDGEAERFVEFIASKRHQVEGYLNDQ